MKGLVVAVFLCLPLTAQAAEWNAQLPTAGERKTADVASYFTVAIDLAADATAAWKSPERAHDLGMMALRVGGTIAIADAVKLGVHRLRPCAPNCGIDSPDSSFYSLHTALAFTALAFGRRPGPRLAITVPFAVGTMGLRPLAGKHWPTDVLAGAAAGAAASFIR